MKKYIISDLHGNGNIYNSIISYLNNVNEKEEVILYINGDLIDRGLDSAYMLLDVKKRIENNIDFKIVYLAGNHEWLMYQTSKKIKNGVWNQENDWFLGNGGIVTAYKLDELVSLKEKLEVIKFISNLQIYHKFDEKIDNKQIVLVHAKCPNIVNNECNIKISDEDNVDTYLSLWSRKYNHSTGVTQNIGNKDYFTIIGHTPVIDEKGYEYYSDENVLNIDGGCAAYACGNKFYDHSPLVEIDSENNRLIILTFNNQNEIIEGNYFKNKKSIKMTCEELNKYRKNIDKNLKIRRLEP